MRYIGALTKALLSYPPVIRILKLLNEQDGKPNLTWEAGLVS